ncbi:MAG: DUF5711 family protein [Oliverpabstia sp.]
MKIKQKMKAVRGKKAILLTTGIMIGCVLLIVGGKYLMDHWTYSGYKVVTETVQEDTISTNYIEFGDNILKYGGDEVSLLSRQGEVLWNEPQTIDNPMVDICGEYCVVYGKNGTTMSVFNMSGKKGSIQTSMPVLKAKVAGQGVVAAVLEDGETTWINLYDVDGEEIVTGKTRVDSPGYPVDLAISDDGLLLCVSYLKVENNKPASYVAFYNFGNTGQNQMDNMVSGYTYAGTLVPDVEYLGNSRAVAFRDDGFEIYQGKQIPEEVKTVKVEEEILAVCNDDSYIGIVFRETGKSSDYRMDIYNKRGELECSTGVDIAFDHMTISKDQILLYNNNEFAVYTTKGVCRYQGAMKEGNLRSFFKVARNRYMAVLDGGVETIKLK